jgi:hypothetical protein
MNWEGLFTGMFPEDYCDAIPFSNTAPRKRSERSYRRLTCRPIKCELRRSAYPVQSRPLLTRGATMANLTNALQELRAERSRAQLHLEKLDQAISVIESLNGSGRSGNTTQAKRIISAASRRKMALAQKARWARAGKKIKPVRSWLLKERDGRRYGLNRRRLHEVNVWPGARSPRRALSFLFPQHPDNYDVWLNPK